MIKIIIEIKKYHFKVYDVIWRDDVTLKLGVRFLFVSGVIYWKKKNSYVSDTLSKFS